LRPVKDVALFRLSRVRTVAPSPAAPHTICQQAYVKRRDCFLYLDVQTPNFNLDAGHMRDTVVYAQQIWPPYLEWAKEFGVRETAVRVFRWAKNPAVAVTVVVVAVVSLFVPAQV